MLSKSKKAYRICDYTYYNVQYQGESHELASIDIKCLSKNNVSYLLREDKFTDVVLEIASKIIKDEKIEINVFHHSPNSDEQRELVRELIMVSDEYWDLYPQILNTVKLKISEFLPIIKLPEYVKEHFKNYSPNQLVWGIKENDWYNQMILHDAAFTVLSAYKRIRQLKRAILHGTEIRYSLNEKNIIITNEESFHNLLVKNLKNSENLKEYINDEKLLI